MEAAPSRTIRIGQSSIGLVGLDQALVEAASQGLAEAEAMDFLFRRIKARNYVPPAMAEQYRLALFREYRRHLGLDQDSGQGLIFRIYGPGCVSCNGLQSLVLEVLAAMNIGADIEQIHDPDEIGRAGILQTPALTINGQLKCAGLLPTRAQIEQWIRELHD